MAHRTLERDSDALWISRSISCKAVDEEKPYHQLEKCAQTGADWPVVSCGFLLCEDCPAEYEEYDLGS